ncbi:MAG: SURF1 family protein [Alphaproteobacteria bacterium]|nr:SURF1 family protein [Alphaproteobacteria bacterium]
MKFPLWAMLFTLAGAALLFKLGWWQLERMAWKADLITKLEAAYASAPSSLLPEGRALSDLKAFERGFIEGEYLPVPTIFVGPQTYEKAPGFHLYSPLRTEGGVVFVNRGWVPLAYKSRAASESPDSGRVRVTGLLRSPERAGLFVAGNEPKKSLWRRADPAQFSIALGLSEPVSPLILFAEGGADAGGGGPIAVPIRADLPNNHFQYALFWFSMGGLLIVFYGLRFHNIVLRKP